MKHLSPLIVIVLAALSVIVTALEVMNDLTKMGDQVSKEAGAGMGLTQNLANERGSGNTPSSPVTTSQGAPPSGLRKRCEHGCDIPLVKKCPHADEKRRRGRRVGIAIVQEDGERDREDKVRDDRRHGGGSHHKCRPEDNYHNLFKRHEFIEAWDGKGDGWHYYDGVSLSGSNVGDSRYQDGM